MLLAISTPDRHQLLHGMRSRLVNARNTLINQLRAICSSVAAPSPKGEMLASDGSGISGGMRTPVLEMRDKWRDLHQRIEALSAEFKDHVRAHETLRHGRVFTGHRHWSRAYARWLSAQKVRDPAQQIVFQGPSGRIPRYAGPADRRDAQLTELVPSGRWRRRWRPIKAVGVFPSSLPSPFWTWCPGGSTGDAVKRGGLSLAGNRRPRALCWKPPGAVRVTEPIRVRLEGLPKAVREIAWKAQTRLCVRYRRMTGAGKKKPIVLAAIAREMRRFLWATGSNRALKNAHDPALKIKVPTRALLARAPPG
ncbi:hypothetical protein [Mesorhizobium sp. M1216]|uniref:hypothetical protein n=1 Tax=Mesorhizobium sp. M1216 TaxID=2957069 RepID=UPI00333DC248